MLATLAREDISFDNQPDLRPSRSDHLRSQKQADRGLLIEDIRHQTKHEPSSCLPGDDVTGSTPLLAFLLTLEPGVPGSESMAEGEVGCSDMVL